MAKHDMIHINDIIMLKIFKRDKNDTINIRYKYDTIHRENEI